jgi:hypothetical protein
MLKSGRMEGVDAFPVPGLKRQMNPGNRAVGLVDPKFVAREVLRALRCEFAPQSLQDSTVKLPTCFEVGDAEMDMIDQAALVALHAGLPKLSSRVLLCSRTRDRMKRMVPEPHPCHPRAGGDP